MITYKYLRQGKINCLLVIYVGSLVQSLNQEVNVIMVKSSYGEKGLGE